MANTLTSNQGNTEKKTNVWSTKKVDAWMKDYAEGIMHKVGPWMDGVVGIKKANITFEYTKEEIEELTKCANDIIYFANKYCYCLHGTQGYKPINLRDYQEEMLTSYSNNRFSCTVSSRQVGKCFFNGKLELQQNKNNFHKHIEDIYYERKSGFLSNVKNFLFKIYRKL